MAKPIVKEGSLDDLHFDSNNANKGTEYGTHLLWKSIQELGVGRGIVAASDGTIIGGNHVTQMLGELGIENVVFVPTDGKTLVVNQRMDIQPNSKQFHDLALADNKVGQANLEFDMDVVERLATDLAIDTEGWGFAPFDESEPSDHEDSLPTGDKDGTITFRLTTTQLTNLKKALATAVLEHDIQPGKEADSLALVELVGEYLGRRQ